jgi:endonuclease III
MEHSERARQIIRRLRKEYPEPKTALHFKTPFELLVATILSAQTTDTLVNRITQSLFNKYKTVKDYSAVSPDEFRNDIRSINFYNTKTKNILASAKMIVEKFGSKVPKTMEELTTLPGVARKTANIILFNCYGINEGIAVDTHVKRLSIRLGLTRHEDPEKIERDLIEITSKDDWGTLSHLLILHGRSICLAKKPTHKECVLYDLCPSRDI